MGRITDYDIQAFVDNELSAHDERRVRAFIEKSPHAQERRDQLISQRDLLKDWWAHYGSRQA